MSFIRLNNILFEKSSVTFRKEHTYVSQSSGITGNMTIASRPSLRVRGDTKDFLPHPDRNTAEVESIERIFNNTAESGYPLNIIEQGNYGIPPKETSLLFHMLENASEQRALRDEKVLSISASYGINSSEIPRVGTPFVPNHGQRTLFPSVFRYPQKVLSPFDAVNSLITSDHESVSSNVLIDTLDNEQLIAPINGPPNQTTFYMDFRDELNATNPSGMTAKNTSRNLLKNSLAKKQVTNVLMPSYAGKYNNCEFAYQNYNTLNFLNTDNYPDDACLVYSSSFFPKFIDYKDSQYFTDFTFSFWINPRYTTDIATGSFSPGTIMHISSSIALSLVSGSSTDKNGFTDGYRIMLQLSHSADTPPSSINLTSFDNVNSDGANALRPGSYTDDNAKKNDLIYLTDDNTLKRNHWHYVSVKWSPDSKNSSGSLRIDDRRVHFHIPSRSLGNNVSLAGRDKIIIGNYFDAPVAELNKFFSENNSKLDSAPVEPSVSQDISPAFNINKSHPLNAEIHEIRGFSKHLSDFRETKIRSVGLENYVDDSVAFHVPVSFSRFIRGGNDYATRRGNFDAGRRIISPFATASLATLDTKIKIDGATSNVSLTERRNNNSFFGFSTPFNPLMSNGIGGKYINLENFVKNFAAVDTVPANNEAYSPMSTNGLESPRLYNLSASLVEERTTGAMTNVAEFFYSQGSIVKRNLMILPNDNGLFSPNFFFLKNEEDGQGRKSLRYKSDYGGTDYGLISLRNIIVSGSEDDRYFDSTRRNFVISYLTQDDDSNDVSIFSIPSLYYGEKIHPGSFEIKDLGVTGSNNKINLNFKDDSRGSLYRADAATKHAKWASVGNVFYDEGICFIKSPHPPCFGKSGHKIKFRAEHTAQILTINIPANRDMIHSSSNVSFTPVSASLNESDAGNDMVYITGINIHDENLNVIMRANLAQPVIKRSTDEFMFKVKMDF